MNEELEAVETTDEDGLGLPKGWENDPNMLARMRAAEASERVRLHGQAETEADADGIANDTEEGDETPAQEAAEETVNPPAALPSAPPPAEFPPEPQYQPAPMEAGEGDGAEPPRTYAQIHQEYLDAVAYGDNDQALARRQELLEIEQQELWRKAEQHRLEQQRNALAYQAERDHPELGPGGDAERQAQFAALESMYLDRGFLPAEALQRTLKTLYPAQPAAQQPEPEPQAPASSHLDDRMTRKRTTVVQIPRASARVAPPAEPRPQTREEALMEMRRARGQL